MPRPQATLFINHLPHGDDATLHAQMAAYGDIVRCFIVRAPDAYGALGESKGYAFVEFGLPSQAKAALRAIEEGYDIDRRRCVPAGWEEFTTAAAAAAGERGSRGAMAGWLVRLARAVLSRSSPAGAGLPRPSGKPVHSPTRPAAAYRRLKGLEDKYFEERIR